MKVFLNYFKRHKDQFLWTFIITFVAQGLFLLSGNVGIDTAESIMTKGDNHYFVCLNMGRQGLVFLKAITGTLLINPYVVGVLSLILLWFSSIVWTYTFSYITKKEDNIVLLLSSFVFLTQALHLETFYFKVQCTEFMINFCLIGLSLLWTYIWIESKKSRYFVASVILMLIYMGTYQALTILYIAGAEMIFLLDFYFIKKNQKLKDMFIYIFKLIACFLTGFIINQIITKVFFSSGNVYYNDLLHWGNESINICLVEIVKYYARYLIGNKIYYSVIFSILMILTIVLLSIVTIKDKTSNGLFLIFILFSIILSPGYLAIALGGNVVYRTQLVYPFLALFIIYFTLSLIDIRKTSKTLYLFKNFFIIASIILIFSNVCNCLRLTYTDHMRNVEDSYIAQDIINRIENYQISNDEIDSIPVFFHGSYERDLNPSCIHGESIGKSMFAQDTNEEPVGYYSTIRCIAYLSQFGKTYNIVNDINAIPILNENASKLPEYPKEGSVQCVDGVILVNLSN